MGVKVRPIFVELKLEAEMALMTSGEPGFQVDSSVSSVFEDRMGRWERLKWHAQGICRKQIWEKPDSKSCTSCSARGSCPFLPSRFGAIYRSARLGVS